MNTDHFKQKLETEKANLEELLASVGGKNPDNPKDWRPEPDNSSQIDSREDVADKFEDFEEREATNLNLEARLKDINDALGKIATGAYGVCEVSGEAIEDDRLMANPSARTCKKHLSALNGNH